MCLTKTPCAYAFHSAAWQHQKNKGFHPKLFPPPPSLPPPSHSSRNCFHFHLTMHAASSFGSRHSCLRSGSIKVPRRSWDERGARKDGRRQKAWDTIRGKRRNGRKNTRRENREAGERKKKRKGKRMEEVVWE